MPAFLYTGTDNRGYACMGAKKAASEKELSAYLEKSGISNCAIWETKTDIERGMFSLVNCAELSLFCKQFSILASSRMTITEIVQLMAFQSENRTLKTALNEIYEIMEADNSFTTALSMYNHIFPADIIYMAIIGEQSNANAEVFAKMARHYEKQAALNAKIRSIIIYPILLSVLMSVVILFLRLIVSPVFHGILQDIGHELSGGTAFILGIGNVLAIIWLLLVLFAVIACAAAIYLIRSGKIRNFQWLSRFKLNSFFTRRVYRRNLVAKVSSALAILLRSGAGLVNAMEVVTPLIENEIVEEKFMNATQDVRDGRDIGEAFEKIGVFSTIFVNMLVSGDKAARLDEMIEKAGEIAGEEADSALERMTSVVEPAFIIVLSIITCMMLAALMLPIIDLMTTIG